MAPDKGANHRKAGWHLMSKRNSEYDRKEHDRYETPPWATRVLEPYLPPKSVIWECAAGTGKMSRELMAMGHRVMSSDITGGHDFLDTLPPPETTIICTNPPFNQGHQFVERALKLNVPIVLMLLPYDFDAAHGRRHLFRYNKRYAFRLNLTKRIRWFEGTTGNPSEHHAWYAWQIGNEGPPRTYYGP